MSNTTRARPPEDAGGGMDVLIGYLLLAGVLASVALIIVGVAWQYIATGQATPPQAMKGTTLAGFMMDQLRSPLADQDGPSLLINLGIIVLMLTPFARVLASVVYFAARERNWKYTVITLFVLAVLTYSLFLR